MPITLDECPLDLSFPASATVGDALAAAQKRLPAGRIAATIILDGVTREGPALTAARSEAVNGRSLTIISADQHDVSLAMLGRLAALIEWLAPQHKTVATQLEKGDQAAAFDGLGRIFSTWQNIQSAYSSLAKLNGITLGQLPVRALTGEIVLNEFVQHLTDMQAALQKHDLVLLADILQYEMDGAVATWMALLEATLGVVEQTRATAA